MSPHQSAWYLEQDEHYDGLVIQCFDLLFPNAPSEGNLSIHAACFSTLGKAVIEMTTYPAIWRLKFH